MILLTILALIIALVVGIIVLGLFAGGSLIIGLFGDLIVFVLGIVLIVKIVKFIKNKK